MAEVQIPPLLIIEAARTAAADKLREARLAIEGLWLLDLAHEVGRIEDRLRRAAVIAYDARESVFAADVPD